MDTKESRDDPLHPDWFDCEACADIIQKRKRAREFIRNCMDIFGQTILRADLERVTEDVVRTVAKSS